LDVFKKVKKLDFFYLSKFLIIILNFVLNYTKKAFLYNFVTNHKSSRPTHYYFVHAHHFSIYNSFFFGQIKQNEFCPPIEIG